METVLPAWRTKIMLKWIKMKRNEKDTQKECRTTRKSLRIWKINLNYKRIV